MCPIIGQLGQAGKLLSGIGGGEEVAEFFLDFLPGGDGAGRFGVRDSAATGAQAGDGYFHHGRGEVQAGGDPGVRPGRLSPGQTALLRLEPPGPAGGRQSFLQLLHSVLEQSHGPLPAKEQAGLKIGRGVSSKAGLGELQVNGDYPRRAAALLRALAVSFIGQEPFPDQQEEGAKLALRSRRYLQAVFLQPADEEAWARSRTSRGAWPCRRRKAQRGCPQTRQSVSSVVADLGRSFSCAEGTTVHWMGVNQASEAGSGAGATELPLAAEGIARLSLFQEAGPAAGSCCWRWNSPGKAPARCARAGTGTGRAA